MNNKLLWECPKCRRKFANSNQSHSCGRYSVEDFLKNKSPQTVALYERFAELVSECGTVVLAPAKTRIGFQVRMIFAAVNKLGENGLDAHIVLARRVENPRFTRIESLSPKNHVHHFRIRAPDETDDELKSWLEEAYKVGAQEHLSKKKKANSTDIL